MFRRLKENNLFITGMLISMVIGFVALVVSVIAFCDYNEVLGAFCCAIFILACLVPLEYIIASCFYLVAVDKGYNDKFYLWFAFIFNIIGYMLVIALPDRSAEKSKDVDVDELPEI